MRLLPRRVDPDDQPIRIKASELRRLTNALRDGYKDSMPPVKSERQRGFRMGWEAAMTALDEAADGLR